jgi:hypothetical protein
MKIVGCDLHTRYQQVAMLDQDIGELIERRLEHESGEARAFYAALSSPVFPASLVLKSRLPVRIESSLLSNQLVRVLCE